MAKEKKPVKMQSKEIGLDTAERLVALVTRVQTLEEMIRALGGMREQTLGTMQAITQAAGIPAVQGITIKAREGIVEWKDADGN